MIDLVERDVTGTFNASGPEDPFRFDEMLYGIRAATTGRVSFTWASTEFLREQEVRPWAHMPVWVPAEGDAVGFSQFSSARALAEGLKYRPLAETARDLLEWHATRPEERRQELRAGISAEREVELLEAWHARGA